MSYQEIKDLIPNLQNIAEINYLIQQLSERKALLKKRDKLANTLGINK